MENSDYILVEVAYALSDQQLILEVELPKEATVEDAIKRSGILERFVQIDLAKDKVGVFGKMCKLDAELHNKDRVEIYRELIADPKESRRQKAEMEKKQA